MLPIKRIPSMLWAATAAMLAATRDPSVQTVMTLRVGPPIPGHIPAPVRTTNAIQFLDFSRRNQRKVRKDRRRANAAGFRNAFSV